MDGHRPEDNQEDAEAGRYSGGPEVAVVKIRRRVGITCSSFSKTELVSTTPQEIVFSREDDYGPVDISLGGQTITIRADDFYTAGITVGLKAPETYCER